MFEKKGLVLGVNVAGYSGLSDMAFDGAQLAKSADYITVPAYDFHGSWERVTGHTAPLTGSGSDNVAASMKYWVSKGVPAKKLMMGIPFYGQTFTLDKPANAKDQAAIGVRTRGAGLPGSITQQAGMLAYFEICTMGKSSSLLISTCSFELFRMFQFQCASSRGMKRTARKLRSPTGGISG